MNNSNKIEHPIRSGRIYARPKSGAAASEVRFSGYTHTFFWGFAFFLISSAVLYLVGFVGNSELLRYLSFFAVALSSIAGVVWLERASREIPLR